MLKNANQIAVSHPFDTGDDSQQASFAVHANVKCLLSMRGRWKKYCEHYVHNLSLLSFYSQPLWPTLSGNILGLKYFVSPFNLRNHVIISRTCIQMPAFADCALLYDVMRR